MTPRSLFATAALLASVAVVPSSAWAAPELQLFAVLSGGNEVGPTGQADAGDPDGHGVAAVTFRGAGAQNTICVVVIVDKISLPSAMHIHRNPAGVNGNIFVEFTPPSTGNGGTSGECKAVPAADAAAIKANPSEFYVNVHTGQFPAGAVRGQLF